MRVPPFFGPFLACAPAAPRSASEPAAPAAVARRKSRRLIPPRGNIRSIRAIFSASIANPPFYRRSPARARVQRLSQAFTDEVEGEGNRDNHRSRDRGHVGGPGEHQATIAD